MTHPGPASVRRIPIAGEKAKRAGHGNCYGRAIEVSADIVFDSWSGGPPTNGASCGRWPRSALTAEQLAKLSGVRLALLSDSCAVDGFSTETVTVFDADGSRATYHEQSSRACTPETVLPASLMLAASSVSDLLVDGSVACE